MKKEQKRKILFYGILAGALLLFAASWLISQRIFEKKEL